MQHKETSSASSNVSVVDQLLTICRNERNLLREFGAARSLRPAHAIFRLAGLGT